MFLPNAQLSDCLAGVIADEAKGQLNRLTFGKLLCFDKNRFLDAAAKLDHLMGIIRAHPDDLDPFFLELREPGA
jgi:hypothetical protein